MKYFRAFTALAVCVLLGHLAAGQTREAKASDSSTAAAASAPKGATPALTGNGTTDYIPLWTSSTGLGDSKLYQSGNDVGIDTTTPQYALDVTGYVNSSRGYRIGEDLILTMPGGLANSNIALGYQALMPATGTQNTAIGYQALENNAGNVNVATGSEALTTNSTGNYNTADGSAALEFNSTGSLNTAMGHTALQGNSTGTGNTAVGASALGGYSGSYNTAIGFEAGNVTTGSFNIAIGNEAAQNVPNEESNNIIVGSMGASTDSAGTIRIGTEGTQTSFFAAGIYGVSSGNSDAIPVLVDSSGQLVTVSSSRRYKEDIQDMGDASSGLMRLRPVTFRYQKPLADGSQPVQYGLIAEEVAEVYPDLVAHSADGKIETVKYQLLDPMLLNEVQRQQAEIQELRERLNKMEATLEAVSHAPASH
jgi:hypothetical protein